MILEPKFEYAFTIKIKLKPKIALGELPHGGDRYYVETLEGSIEGPGIKGTIIPGSGGDWAHVRPDGVLDFDARYSLMTDDGQIIYLQNRGFRWGTPEIMAKMARREPVDPSEYYMRVSPYFEVQKGKYDWLTRYVFVGVGDKVPEGNAIHYYKVI